MTIPQVRRLRVAIRIGILALGLQMGALIAAGPTLAYNPNAAASYADAYAASGNCATYPCFSADCANFVSQALNAGGIRTRGTYGSPQHDDHYWWLSKKSTWVWVWSDSWASAPHLRSFLLLYGNPDYGTRWGSDTSEASGVATGDVLFYDWENNGSIDHTGIRVAHGTDPGSGRHGDLADLHTTNHYHAFWSLRDYNAYWASTKIYLVHINASFT